MKIPFEVPAAKHQPLVQAKPIHPPTQGTSRPATKLVIAQSQIDASPKMLQLRSLQENIDRSWKTQQTLQLQARADQSSVKQSQQKNWNSGLPSQLKAGIESLSGHSMDDVNVHYNSSKPAQVKALAFAQGQNIHLGPGQEKHLAHEAWHVVQQKQGRVKPTLQMKGGLSVNDDKGLEREADVMGAKASRWQAGSVTLQKTEVPSKAPLQRQVIQRVIEERVVTGISHLVVLQNGSLYNESFLENEYKEVTEEDLVEIETDEPLRSRRGPNQEEFAIQDNTFEATTPRLRMNDDEKAGDNEETESSSQPYVWYPVRSLNYKAVPPDTYIRVDVMRKLEGWEAQALEKIDRYAYAADYARSREGKHWWASFNNDNEKRTVGVNVLNATAVINMRKVMLADDSVVPNSDDLNTWMGNRDFARLFRSLVPQQSQRQMKAILAFSNSKIRKAFKSMDSTGVLSNPNHFILSLLAENEEENEHLDLLNADEDHANSIVNCEEFAMYILVGSGFMTRLELSTLLKVAASENNLKPVYEAMGFYSGNLKQVGDQETKEGETLNSGILFEVNTKKTSIVNHVVFAAGKYVMELAFGDQLCEWRAEKSTTTEYLNTAASKNKMVMYSPLSRRNVEAAMNKYGS